MGPLKQSRPNLEALKTMSQVQKCILNHLLSRDRY